MYLTEDVKQLASDLQSTTRRTVLKEQGMPREPAQQPQIEDCQ